MFDEQQSSPDCDISLEGDVMLALFPWDNARSPE
jgi:hypothetical protein